MQERRLPCMRDRIEMHILQQQHQQTASDWMLPRTMHNVLANSVCDSSKVLQVRTTNLQIWTVHGRWSVASQVQQRQVGPRGSGQVLQVGTTNLSQRPIHGRWSFQATMQQRQVGSCPSSEVLQVWTTHVPSRTIHGRWSFQAKMQQRQVGPSGSDRRPNDSAMWTDGPLQRHIEELVQATTYRSSRQASNPLCWKVRQVRHPARHLAPGSMQERRLSSLWNRLQMYVHQQLS